MRLPLVLSDLKNRRVLLLSPFWLFFFPGYHILACNEMLMDIELRWKTLGSRRFGVAMYPA